MNLWDQDGVPHKGWSIEDHFVVDFYTSCEMCGKERICFVYRMSHPDYHSCLDVGCVCAENMSQDYVTPKILQKTLKNRINRKRNFQVNGWKISSKGNEYRKIEGNLVVIMKRPNNKFSFCAGGYFSRRIFECDIKAKAAAFDYVTDGREATDGLETAEKHQRL